MLNSKKKAQRVFIYCCTKTILQTTRYDKPKNLDISKNHIWKHWKKDNYKYENFVIKCVAYDKKKLAKQTYQVDLIYNFQEFSDLVTGKKDRTCAH